MIKLVLPEEPYKIEFTFDCDELKVPLLFTLFSKDINKWPFKEVFIEREIFEFKRQTKLPLRLVDIRITTDD